MAFMPVQYDSSEISVEKLNRYRVNYPILGFFGGIFLSVLIIIVRKSYLKYKDENLAKEKQ